MRYQPEDIARVCYEANRALQNVLGDAHPSEPWDALSADARAGYTEAVQKVATDRWPSPARQHLRWLSHMLTNGWRYGPQVDEVAKTHPMMIEDYALVPRGQRDKDVLFLAVVKALAPNMAP